MVKGLGESSFSVVLKKEYFVNDNRGRFKVEVTKIYKYQWFRILLLRLGFKVKLYECKVIEKIL